MNTFGSSKFVIHDYSKISKNRLDRNKKNISPNKILVGKNIQEKKEGSKLISLKYTDTSTNETGHCTRETQRKSSSFDFLLKSLLTPPLNNNDHSAPVIQEDSKPKIILDHNKKNISQRKKVFVGNNTHVISKSVDDLVTSITTISSSSDETTVKTEKCGSFDLILQSLLTPTLNNNINNNQSERETSNSEGFEDLMNKILTPSFATRMSQHDNKKPVKQTSEAITQTSFEDSSDLNGTQNTNFTNISRITENIINVGTNKEAKLINSSQISTQHDLPYFCSQFNTSIEEGCSNNNAKFNNSLDHANITTSSYTEQSTQNKLEVNQSSEKISDDEESIKDILDVFAQDITLVANKVHFNCIHKIATDKWLKYALNVAGKRTTKRKKYEYVEVYCDFTSCFDSNHKYIIKRYCKGNRKIVKFENDEIEEVQEISPSASTSPPSVLEEDGEETDLRQLTEVERRIRLEIDKLSKDKDLLSNENHFTILDKNKLKSTIHDIFVKLYDVLQDNKLPHFSVRKSELKNCIFKDGRFQLEPITTAPIKRFNLTVKTMQLKFCRMLYIMAKAYLLLDKGTTLTKREIFYQIKHLLRNQQQIYSVLEEVTRLLNVGQWHLNIVAHSGLVYGKLRLKWASGTIIDCSESATIMPVNIDEVIEIESTAFFILVVEKESIFQKLFSEDLPNKLGRPFIMMTGKGVPDFNTQLFLKRISTALAIPVFILVDADVYGIKIMLNYRFGSIKSCHLSEHLALPNARWLGVFPSEISRFGMPHLKLKNRDRSLLKNMMQYPCLDDNPRILEELNYLMNSNKKASIEGLIKNNTFLSESYLPTKFFNQDFI